MAATKAPDLDFYAQLRKQSIYKDYFFVKKNNRNIRVDINEIFWIKADGSSIDIYFIDGTATTYVNLTSFLKQIDHPLLSRVHRSYIVNLLKVTSFDDQFLYIKVKNKETKIPFGRTYRKKVLGHFNHLKSD